MTISESLMSEWRKFADQCTPRTETGSLNYRMFAVLVRNEALEEAAEYLEEVHQSRLVKFAEAIRKLKEPTP